MEFHGERENLIKTPCSSGYSVVKIINLLSFPLESVEKLHNSKRGSHKGAKSRRTRSFCLKSFSLSLKIIDISHIIRIKDNTSNNDSAIPRTEGSTSLRLGERKLKK